MKPPEPGKPLSSDELEEDARRAEVSADEINKTGGNAHIPASEEGTGFAEGEDEKGPNPVRDIVNLPPG